jgi:hypothetical protein
MPARRDRNARSWTSARAPARPSRDLDAASTHHVHTIGDVEHSADVLLDEQHADTLIGGAAHGREQPIDDERSQPEGQLVGEEQARLPSQRPAQGEHLLFTEVGAHGAAGSGPAVVSVAFKIVRWNEFTVS